MKDRAEIETAWKVCNLISRLNDLIWDYYEDGFIELYLKEEYQNYLLKKQIDDDIPFWLNNASKYSNITNIRSRPHAFWAAHPVFNRVALLGLYMGLN